MRSEQEVREFLGRCEKSRGFGGSRGPCPLQENEKKDCVTNCTWEAESFTLKVVNDIFPNGTEEEKRAYIANEKKMCCEEWDRHVGCCAECSFPSAMKWVLGKEGGATDNGQKMLFKALKST